MNNIVKLIIFVFIISFYSSINAGIELNPDFEIGGSGFNDTFDEYDINLELNIENNNSTQTLIPPTPDPTPTSPTGGGGGGGSTTTILKDDCPSGDYSSSYYDKNCGVNPDISIVQPFDFKDKINVELNTFIESESIKIEILKNGTGSTDKKELSVIGGEYKIGTGAWLTGSSLISNGDILTLNLKSGTGYLQKTMMKVTIDDKFDDFGVITKNVSGGGNSKEESIQGKGGFVIYDEKKQTQITSLPEDGVCSIDKNSLKLDLNKNYCKAFKNFSDIGGNFAEYYINVLAKNCIVHGFEDGAFKPKSTASRSEYLKMILGGAGIDYKNTITSDLNFEDVDKNSWNAKVIKKALEIGIISDKNKFFRPNDSITRAEAIKISMLLIGHTENKTLEYFEDVKGTWSSNYTSIAKDLCIVSGQQINNELVFRPNDVIKRDEVSKIVFNAMVVYRLKNLNN